MRSETGGALSVAVERIETDRLVQKFSRSERLDKDWKTYRYEFTAKGEEGNCRLWFGRFERNHVYELRRASIREILD